MTELNYDNYEKIAKKYKITTKTSTKTVKKKIISFILEVYKIGDYSLFSSRIMDNFFENGDRIINATKEAIKENVNLWQVENIARKFGI
jgi:hypothetical protein